MPGRHRKKSPPILPIAMGALGVTAVLLGTASATPPLAAPAPTAVALAAFTADAPTEWWQTTVPRRPVVKPEPVVAAPAQPTAVTRPVSAPLRRQRPAVQHAAPERAPGAQEAATKAPATTAGGKVSCSGGWLSGVKQVAKVAGCDVANRFGVTDIGGLRAGSREHGSGKALDLMVGNNRAKGDAIAAYLLANWDALGIQHIIWQQRINYGSGWKGMASRGSATADHRDHIHLLLR